MNKQFTYTFRSIEQCNMCGSGHDRHKVLGKRLNSSQGKNPCKKAGITTTVIRCIDCGLVFCNPIPIPENIQDHYGIPAEEYWLRHQLEEDFSRFLPELQLVKSYVSFKPSMRSLEIGAGHGVFMKACLEAGFDAYGCEPSEPFYKRLIEKMNFRKDRLHLGKVESCEFPDNFFDFISFKAVLEHLYDPSLAITRCLKWLKPGGIICIEVPSSDWFIGKIFNLYYRLRSMDYTSHLSPMHSPFHLFEFSLQSFQKHAAIHGYSIYSHQFFVCDTFMPKLLNRPLKAIMRRNGSGMDLYLLLQKKNL